MTEINANEGILFPVPMRPEGKRYSPLNIATRTLLCGAVGLYMAGCGVGDGGDDDAFRLIGDESAQEGVMAVCVGDDLDTEQVEDDVVVPFEICEEEAAVAEEERKTGGTGNGAYWVLWSHVNNQSGAALPVVGSRYSPSVLSAFDAAKPVGSQLTQNGASVRVPASSVATAAAKAEFGGFGRSISGSSRSTTIGKSIGKSGGFGGKTSGS